jgi:hypothetical protein
MRQGKGEIADYLDVHYSGVCRVIKGLEKQKRTQAPVFRKPAG